METERTSFHPCPESCVTHVIPVFFFFTQRVSMVTVVSPAFKFL